MWSFDVKNRAWEKARIDFDSPIPRARDRHVVIADNKAERLILFGGNDGDKHLNDLWVYDIKLRRWKEIKMKTRPPPRNEHCMVIAGDSVIIFSGKSRKGGLDDIWIAKLNRLEQWRDMTLKFIYPD